MIDPNEVEAIVTVVEARLHEAEGSKQTQRRHWPRRVVIMGGVLVMGAAIHHVIENTGLRSFMQSSEMVLAAMLDAAFSKAREV